jgi:predicted RNase H-like nuclease (RuvC/YqgF family)
VVAVLEVKPGAFRPDLELEGDEVFVFGRQVEDFHSVDYDAIAMLNVSATQQIKREKDSEIRALQEENSALRAKLAAQQDSTVSLEARLIAIEQRLSGESTAPETVSLRTANAAK